MIKNSKKGFSLMEMIIAVAILAVFAAFAIPSYISLTQSSREKKDETKLVSVCNAFKTAMSDPESKYVMDEFKDDTTIIVNCYINVNGEVSFRNGDFVGYLDDGSVKRDKLHKLEIWDSMYQSIGNEYSVENRDLFEKYIVFTLTPKTSSSTADCQYKIQNAPQQSP